MTKFCYKINEVSQDAWHLLDEIPVAVVSTVSQEGKPMSAAVYYYRDDDGNLYFVTKTESRKFSNFQISPVCSMLVIDPEKMRTLEMEGSVEIILDSGDLLAAVKKIVDRTSLTAHKGWLPVLQTEGMNLALIKVIPERWCWTEFDK